MSTPGFAPFATKMRAEGLPEIAIAAFERAYGLLGSGDLGKISRRDIAPVDDLPDAAGLAQWRDAGRAALDRTVVIKLNGGLGTSMGMTRAKSLLRVKQGLTFLDIIVRQVLHLRETHGARLPLVLMNSFRTRDDSLALLARHPALDVGLPLDFLQHKVPRILKSDRTPVAWPSEPEHEWCPPGHGDIYAALVTSGTLAALLERGIEYAFVSNADNLGAVLDLDILGWFAAEQVPFLMEVADRTEADRKGGHLARSRGGGLLLRESAQCPDDEKDDFQNIAVHRFFNTNNLWVNLRTLARTMDETHGVLPLPLIANEKPVDPADPTSPTVIQLETAMGAAIGVFPGARAVRVPRARLVPVKTTSDLLSLWSDVHDLTDDFRVVVSPRRTLPPIFVDLDQKFFRRVPDVEARFPAGAPSLVDAARFVVEGDVRFAGTATVRGDVRVTGPTTVPDGAVLAGA
ncbi:MAG TPA: UTP--glucose-1-phosphate uridylyltransferase [Candidatus Binatia bacterium]|jgi:UTP--glucose-1-phosphate uridylyltransferase|nr:UTP--glucose-1-phosphate uridylyltransferase [Candidatus Binatia bacterium]